MTTNYIDITRFLPPEGCGAPDDDPAFKNILTEIEKGRRPTAPIRVTAEGDVHRIADRESWLVWSACRKVGSGIGQVPEKLVEVIDPASVAGPPVASPERGLPRPAAIRAEAKRLDVDISDLDIGGGRRSKPAMLEMLARIEAARAAIDGAVPDAQPQPDAAPPADDGQRLVRLADLKLDEGIQARAAMNNKVVAEYEALMREGVEFPPIVVFGDGEALWLADGFHRVEGARLAGLDGLQAEVHSGSRRDAVLCAVGANATHGLRRTNVDKRRAVQMLLDDPEWSQWSDREIARRAGVTPTLVGKCRPSVHDGQMPTRKVRRGDKTFDMNVGRKKTKTKKVGRTKAGADVAAKQARPNEPVQQDAVQADSPEPARPDSATEVVPGLDGTGTSYHVEADPVGHVSLESELDLQQARERVVEAALDPVFALAAVTDLLDAADVDYGVVSGELDEVLSSVARLLVEIVDRLAAADPEQAEDWLRTTAGELLQVVAEHVPAR